MLPDSPNDKRDTPTVHRSGRFLLYFQAQGLCEALRLLAQTGNAPGPATIQVVKGIQHLAGRIGQGPAFEVLPEVNEQSPMSDLLVIAEVMRTLMLAFLTAEEYEDQRRTFGFGGRLG